VGRAHRPGAQAPLWQRLIQWPILGEGRFAQRYVFPDGELVPVSDANLVAEQAGFEVRDVENLREHYALTLRQWVKRLEARRDVAVALTDDVTYRIWRLYMAGSAYRFETGHLSVNQTVLAKPDQGKSHLPLSRADLYMPR
jgi:cyclopropane-fatty-acyl-phospholipid synthase